ncbi:hypothetical protein DO72_3953 [Burkholderia pseudomallei]|nr:hypothetical protein DO73_4158 [Burkholderia pseudomallei]KOS76431.1 hypothetical protein DM46_2499 [Burkholderia mallei]KGD13750.1 hypothetical protein DO70_3736 [Burkholderia pseudomallei]KGD39749.1 hypothetical protein DO72_3953 [Burkholderia pseudomallei]KGD49997.1 hypothetical protein DP43_4148 [Burkholderia pseudomallei]
MPVFYLYAPGGFRGRVMDGRDPPDRWSLTFSGNGNAKFRSKPEFIFSANVKTARGQARRGPKCTERLLGSRQPICCMIEISFFA